MSRRSSIFVSAALCLGLATGCAPAPADDGAAEIEVLWSEIIEQARSLAQAPYQAPESRITPTVAGLSYGQLRGISFRGEAGAWVGEGPFQVQLFHPGGGFETPVQVTLVEDGEQRLLDFDPGRFRYGDEVEGMDLGLPAEAGHAGFRVLYPLNDPDRMDEVISFLGASYFRLLGPGHVYGLSARGIAVDVAEPSGEEFPDFVAFWMVQPASDATELEFFGILDGPSLSGAYRFELAPGAPGAPTGAEDARPTVLSVDARLFAREDMGRLGVAPLTSMYLHGTFRRGGDDDFRPRVHDSEGLLMHTRKDEWIWRPLSRRRGVQVTSLRDVDPRGFGLAQRDRDFDSYLDLEARYDRRPSLWVAPGEEWGPGGVELIELPTNSEFNDNVVAYWRPDAPFRSGEERRYRYQLVTFDDRLAADASGVAGDAIAGQRLAQVHGTRIGWDGLPGQASPPPRSQRRVVVDFARGGLGRLNPSDSVGAVVETFSGSVREVQVQALPPASVAGEEAAGGVRATFTLLPDPERGADIRLYLTHADTAVSETWSYLWEAARDR